MKKIGIIVAGLAVSLLGGASTFAEEGEKGRPDFPEMRQRLVEEFDEDGDGELNEEERDAARKQMRERRGRRERGPRAEGRGPRADRGPAEGRRRERGPAMEEGRGRGKGKAGGRGRGSDRGGPQGSPMGDPDRIFERLDADGDGILSKKEFAGGMRRMMESRGRPGPPDRGDRLGRRGSGAERDGDFDGERFRPNFNRDAEDDREGRRPPRMRDRGPRRDRGEFRDRGREFGPRKGPPGMERGRGFGPDGRRGPPEFRRGRPPREELEDEAPRPERRRRGRRPEAQPREKQESTDDSASKSEPQVEASVDTDTV